MPDGTNFHLAVLTKNLKNPAYAGARLGADRVAERLGARVRHYVPDIPDDIDQQCRLIEDALADKADALVIVPVHPRAIDSVLDRADSAGVPIICFASRLAERDCVTFVGSENHELAFSVATFLFEATGKEGKFVILEGHPNSPNAEPRTDGFRAAAARYPAVEIVDTARGDFLQEPARLAMTDMLARHPRIDGVLAANDAMAIGAVEAMRAAGRPVPVIGANASPEGIAAVRNGELLATASFDAMKMACIATEAAIRHLAGLDVPKVVMLPAETVHAGNYAAWDGPYSERPLPDWDETLAAARPAAAAS